MNAFDEYYMSIHGEKIRLQYRDLENFTYMKKKNRTKSSGVSIRTHDAIFEDEYGDGEDENEGYDYRHYDDEPFPDRGFTDSELSAGIDGICKGY